MTAERAGNSQTDLSQLIDPQALLRAVANAQAGFLAGTEPARIFAGLLDAMLRLTGSHQGMIVQRRSDGAAFHPVAAQPPVVAGDDCGGIWRRRVDTVLATGAPARGDAADSFLALPIVSGPADRPAVIGVVGLADRPGGYDGDLADLLQPLLLTAATLLSAGLRQSDTAISSDSDIRRISDIVGNLGEIVWSARLPGFQPLYVSPAIETLTGYAADRVIADADFFDAITPPEDLAVRNAALEQAMRSGRCDVVYRLRRADDGLRWVRCKGAVFYDAKGRPQRIDGTLSDVTAEREALEQARKTEALYRAVVEDQQEAIIRFRPDFTVTFVNRQYAGYYNLAPEDLLGIRMSDLLTAVEFGLLEGEVAALSPAKPTLIQEYEKILPDGSTRWLRWVNRALFDTAGTLGEVQCVGHDITDLKRLESELAAGRELFGLVVASSGDGIFDWNVDTGEVWYSPRWKEIFGYRDDELENTYETWERLIHPEDRQMVLDRGAAYFREPVGVLRSLARYRHRNGSIVYIESRVIRRQNAADGCLRVVGAYSDVTEKVLAEQRMRDAIESLPDAFVWFDADDHVIMHNERYLEFFPFMRAMGDLRGKSFAEMVRSSFGQLGRAVDVETYVTERMDRHRQGGSFEMRLEDDTWVRVSERRTADNGTVSVWSNISDLKQAQQRLLDAVESMQEGFLLIGPDRRVILSNRHCREMYPIAGHLLAPGCSYEAFVRFGAMNGQFLEALDRNEDYVAEALALLENRSEMRVERELAGGRWVLVSQRCMDDGSVVSIRTDLTPQKMREAELEAARNQLAKQAAVLVDLAEKLEEARLSAVEASKAKTRFLAHMSHELRTPLNAILGFAKLIGDEMFGPIGVAKYAEYAGLIHESGSHLLSLINDVLDLSKIEAGRMVLDCQAVSVDALAAGSTRLMEGLAKDRNVHLCVEVMPDCRQVFGDERAIKQMIINLLSNALKFTPASGTVTLQFAVDGAGAAITVTDTGIGMTENDIEKALDPFGQVDGEIARQHQGTGLGLPLVKVMAEVHGGSLEIESEPGRGTTMRIRLPGDMSAGPQNNSGAGDRYNSGSEDGSASRRDLADGGATDDFAASSNTVRSNRRILLAEDNPMNQRLFIDVLRTLGAEIDCVEDGEAAVERAIDGGYDLILMDIQMPKMGGVDATRRIRAESALSEVPIIALTAHAMEGDRDRYLAAGMTDYLTKPVDLTALLTVVSGYLGLSPVAA
ncbi:MAG: PAS domain S-box protein [Rhodospirillaceae bacterium]|nr:MAG: PAS domain S-box protein [Rhodospirillaceae bacterium]